MLRVRFDFYPLVKPVVSDSQLCLFQGWSAKVQVGRVVIAAFSLTAQCDVRIYD